MTFHTRTIRKPKGSKVGAQRSPRIAISLPPEDMRLICWLADVKKRPVAEILRDAAAAYVLPFRNNPMLKKQFGSEP